VDFRESSESELRLLNFAFSAFSEVDPEPLRRVAVRPIVPASLVRRRPKTVTVVVPVVSRRLRGIRLEGGSHGRSAELPENTRRLEAQLHAASGRSSKLIKDAESIEAVLEVPGRGTLTLSVHSGGGYSLRARPGTEAQGDESEGRGLLAVGVLGVEEVVSVVPG
jgi:hypothetical protein